MLCWGCWGYRRRGIPQVVGDVTVAIWDFKSIWKLDWKGPQRSWSPRITNWLELLMLTWKSHLPGAQIWRFWFSRWCPSISYFSQVLQVVRTCNHPNSLWLQKSSAPATDVGTKAERVKGSSPRSPSQWAADPRPALWSSEQNKTEFLLSPSKNRIKRQEERQKDAISHLITSCHVVTIFLIWSPTLMDQK